MHTYGNSSDSCNVDILNQERSVSALIRIRNPGKEISEYIDIL